MLLLISIGQDVLVRQGRSIGSCGTHSHPSSVLERENPPSVRAQGGLRWFRGTADKVFVQMREHLEQGEYDVDEIMCQQYLFLSWIV